MGYRSHKQWCNLLKLDGCSARTRDETSLSSSLGSQQLYNLGQVAVAYSLEAL
jgi:hypothetical protein